jgi:hypothetical protein
MHLSLNPIPALIFILGWAYLLWNWVGWLKSGLQIPKRRTIMNGLGLSFVTISSILATFLYIHAVITGGYPFYDPIEMRCMGIGTLTALAGLAAGIGGKGKLRISVAVISTLNLFLWFIDAVAQ